MSKKILVINGNPKESSFCHELAEQYVVSGQRNHEVKVVSVSELKFDLDLHSGYDKVQSLEPDLAEFQSLVKWGRACGINSASLVGGRDARKIKGADRPNILIRICLQVPRRQDDTRQTSSRPKCRYYSHHGYPHHFTIAGFRGNPIYKQLKRTVLEFCGITVRPAMYIGPVISSSKQQRTKWGGEQVFELAAKL